MALVETFPIQSALEGENELFCSVLFRRPRNCYRRFKGTKSVSSIVFIPVGGGGIEKYSLEKEAPVQKRLGAYDLERFYYKKGKKNVV
ncbi:hypothetical protein TNCT_605991 [Trichonephila clavata]|uniref:Uncharacterized protein n=1 Tax=Trichonephila clavata TaxID=2740835 RepID=A0A8X6H1D6_TRICU|nr:hypothetical protein TNCT_605991 [Trichonephila clavata]